MVSREEYKRTLDRLVALLNSRACGWRIAELAEAMGCARPIAYRRIQALQEREGASVWSAWAGDREGRPGPLPKLYGFTSVK